MLSSSNCPVNNLWPSICTIRHEAKYVTHTNITIKIKSLDTYSALADAGIVPSRSKTYTLAEIRSALSKVTGFDAVVSCYRGQLNQAWYYYNVRGSVQTGQFVATNAPVRVRGNCPRRGIRYLPKSSGWMEDEGAEGEL